MARDLDALVVQDLSNSSLISATLVELYYDTNTIRFTNAPYNITIGVNEYFGVGNLGVIQPIEETANIQSLSMSVSLSGINTSIVPIALDENYQGRRAKVYIAYFENNHSVIGTPVLIFDGRMDYMDINLGKEAEITLYLESKFVEWEKAKVRRYNSIDQRVKYPNDKGLDFVEEIENVDFPWGIKE